MMFRDKSFITIRLGRFESRFISRHRRTEETREQFKLLASNAMVLPIEFPRIFKISEYTYSIGKCGMLIQTVEIFEKEEGEKFGIHERTKTKELPMNQGA